MESTSKKRNFLSEDLSIDFIQRILLDDELNRNIVDSRPIKKSLHIRSKIHEAMCKGISNQEASDLLEQYDEIDNGIHEAEREHWLKVGIRIGYEFFPIINKSSQL
ncbi:MAG: hypothetical protein E7192_07470 [Erysipelotrichaceae bacterium]|nr:hypothetical protein [Erysipelotrichaceae bacterium]